LVFGSYTWPPFRREVVVIDKKGMVREVIQGIIFPEEFEQKV
jgi:hypothetical protein